MSDRKRVTLRQMPAGRSGKVVEIQGGMGLVNRLSALGLRSGKKITKVSSMLMRGPVTVQLGNTRLAIGFGMAERIIVELDEA
ncbi:MAG: ferrous iron transport protein A [Dehalococcoidales bacterium]